MLYLEGRCASCLVGTLGVRRCDDGATLVLMCDECEAVWLDPADRSIDAVRYPSGRTFEIPGTAHKIGGGAAGWATADEVDRAGWRGEVAGETPDPGRGVRKRPAR